MSYKLNMCRLVDGPQGNDSHNFQFSVNNPNFPLSFNGNNNYENFT